MAEKDKSNIAPTGTVEKFTTVLEFPVDLDSNPEAIIIHCDDPRFQNAFRNFIEGQQEKGCLELAQGKYVPIIIPGGISSLSEMDALPKHFKVTKEQIEFILDHFHSVKVVILINHEDCQAYESLREKIGTNTFLRSLRDMAERQKVDLSKVSKFLVKHFFTGTNFKLYFAKFANEQHTQVTFEEVTK
ncbi:MAG: hypothetical protein WC575_00315 [Patescibacteria group bacterium]